MASHVAYAAFAYKLARRRSLLRSISPLFFLFLGTFWGFVPAASAQFPSAFVFASDPKGVAVYTRNDATGILTPVADSPFPSKEAVTSLALDFKGRYLFTANYVSSKISMFTINTDTGALQEVPNSPFASINTDTPMLLAAEVTGQRLYVVNFYGSTTQVSSVESFQIDSPNQQLVPSSSGAVDLPGLYVGGAVHPSGKTFYGYFNNPSPSDPNAASFLVFDSASGSFTSTAFPSGSPALCFAMDPAGLHAVMASGSNTGQIFTQGLNTDGTPSEFSASVVVPKQPESLALDTLGKYLYATLSTGGSQPSSVHIYSPITLAELSNSPLPSTFTCTASWLVDPSAPLIFADQVYQVSPADGSLTSIFGPSTLSPPAVFSLPPSTQPIEGPVAQLSSASFSFGSLAVGVTSSTQTLTVTNTGGQNLSINTLAISGTNASDFSEQDTCHVPTVLTPNQVCTATISFTPSATGTRSASLAITDNAAPPSESVTVTGTGVPQTSSVTLIPGSLSFGSASSPITEGTSTTSSVTVTNSGGLVLHISNIALTGANANDYSFSAPNCNSAIAVSSNCAITVTFLPLAVGLRSAAIVLTDDAPDSPQTIQVNGFANSSVTNAPTVALAPPALVFGSVAAPISQGTSISAGVTVTNSGTGALHISNITLSGSNSNEFSFSAPGCSTAIVINSNCSIAVTFTPLAPGVRSATITLADDAPNSPQTIQITGNAAAAFTFAPAPGASTTATVSPGQSATFNLQITPGPSYSGSITLTCSGAPSAATCNVPQSILVSNGTAAPFSVTVSTTAAAAVIPVSQLPHATPPANFWLMPLIVLYAMTFFYVLFGWSRSVALHPRRRYWSYSLAGFVFLTIALSVSGCGGGGSVSSAVVNVPPPPPSFTPARNYTLVVTATPAAQSGKPLPSQTIQLTLTVN